MCQILRSYKKVFTLMIQMMSWRREEEDEDSLKLERVSGSLFESGVRPQPMIMSQRLPVQEVHASNIERIQSRIDSDDSDDKSEMEEINDMEDDDGMIKTE